LPCMILCVKKHIFSYSFLFLNTFKNIIKEFEP
jgi:hypothetical protein